MKNILITNWGISSQLIVDEAKKLNINTKIISKENNLFHLKKDGKIVYFKSVDCGLNTAFGLKTANNKEITYLLAEENNIRVPKSNYIDRNDIDSIKLEKLNIQFPVVSKPIDGAHGDGVAMDLNNYEQLKVGIQYSFEDNNTYKIVVQEQIMGDDHRIIVVNGKVEAVTKRIPPYIIGNGSNTIKELIDMENKNPLRGKGNDHDAPMSPIKIDKESENFIKEQGFLMSHILDNKEEIYVRQNANLSTGGLAIDLTDETHFEIKKEAEKISKTVGLGFCGVDFFCKDISLSLKEGNGAIIEVNATPGIRMHHFPSIGKPRNIAKKIIEAVF